MAPLSLWVGAVSTGDGFSHRWERNSEFCIAVGPVIRTAGILWHMPYVNWPN